MSKYVISTLAADNTYANWNKSDGVNTINRKVLVRGGAGIRPRGGVAPEGVQTEVSDEDAAYLATHPQFMEHAERGFVRIESSERDPDRSAREMERDGSRPRTAADVAEDNRRANRDQTDTAAVQAVTNRRAGVADDAPPAGQPGTNKR
jgi:hypothetical protein